MSETHLDEILLSKGVSPDISVIYKHNDFPVYLQQGKPVLMQYIVRNFDRILEIIFEEYHRDIREIRPLLSILECKEIYVKRALVTSTKFVNYILEYPNRIKIYNPPSAGIFFNSLSAFILDKNNELLPFFANIDFFRDIVSNCDIQEAYVFMRNCLLSKSASFNIFFAQINIPSILIHFVVGNTGLNLNVIKLFEIAVEKYPVQSANAVVHADVINQIINSAFLLNCSRLIDFLNFLYVMSYKFKMEAQWFNIEFLIDDRIPEVCDYLLSTTNFDSMCRASANILLTYLNERHQQFPKVIYVSQKFANDIFKNPTNSFLHITAYKFLESIKIYPSRFKEVIEATDLCNKIIEAYKKRATDIGCCYWGALRKISELIDEPVNVSVSEWQRTVVNANIKKEKVIATPVRTSSVASTIKQEIKEKKKFRFRIKKPSLTDIASVLVCIFAVLLLYLNNRN